MRKIVIATHGKLASGFKDAAKLIVGNIADNISCYELLPGLNASNFANEIYEKYKNYEEIYILCDLYGASVSNAMYSLTKYNNFKIISGLNLEILLNVLLKDEGLMESFKNSIVLLNDIKCNEESEDF